MGIKQQYFKAKRILNFPKEYKNFSLAPILVCLSLIALILVSSYCIFFWEKLERLEDEKNKVTEVLSESAMLESSPSMDVKVLEMPKFEELPMVIEECTDIFAEENVRLLSFNLERFGNESSEKLTILKYAVVRMKVLGSWEGILRGLNNIETLPDQMIKVDETLLERERGEFLFRIYYQEPNNP